MCFWYEYLRNVSRNNNINYNNNNNNNNNIIDAPQEEGTYQKRHLFLQNHLFRDCNYNTNVSLIPIQICLGRNHLQNCLEEVIIKGGIIIIIIIIIIIPTIFIII